MKRQNLILLGALGVIVALVAVLLYVTAGGGPGADDQEIISSPNDPSAPVQGEDGAFEIPPNDPVERLDRYRKWAVYPPSSRPLYSGQVDLLDPFNAARPPVGVIQTPAADCETTATGGRECKQPARFSEITCDMTPESTISVGRGDFKVFVSCANARGEKQKLSGVTAKVYRKVFRKVTASLPPIAMGDDGQNGDATAGDLVYTVLVRPSAQDWGQMFVEIEGEIGGLKHSQRAAWYSTPHTVAELGTGVRDQFRDGHLLVTVPVNVTKAGYYEFEANLVEQGGEQRPVASAVWEGDLPAGARVVELQFWGKVIRDADVDGPYLVTDLRAKRNNSPVSPTMIRASLQGGTPVPPTNTTEPLWEYVRPAGQDFATQAYDAAQFSDAEWNSEEKQQRLRFLEEQAR